jgi:fatty-acyl-CoA synthase
MATGDAGRFDEDGRLFIEGRSDDMIVLGGENVFPREVADTIHAMPDVSEVSVIGVEDEQWGRRLKAFVVKREAAELSVQEVTDHVKRSLAGCKVPREVVFLDELPRNATGKCDEAGARRAVLIAGRIELGS